MLLKGERQLICHHGYVSVGWVLSYEQDALCAVFTSGIKRGTNYTVHINHLYNFLLYLEMGTATCVKNIKTNKHDYMIGLANLIEHVLKKQNWY